MFETVKFTSDFVASVFLEQPKKKCHLTVHNFKIYRCSYLQPWLIYF